MGTKILLSFYRRFFSKYGGGEIFILILKACFQNKNTPPDCLKKKTVAL